MRTGVGGWSQKYIDLSQLSHTVVGGVFLTLLTYNRVQPLSVGNGKAALLGAPAACDDSRDKRVLGGKSGVGEQGSPL